MKQLLTQPLLANQLPLVNKFYKQQRARGKAKGNERVFVTRTKEGIIAAARLADISGCCFLTGVQVGIDHQRQGVAKALIGAIVETLEAGQTLYTFPYQHLLGLYLGLGFTVIEAQQLPNPLQQRLARYQGQGRDIVAVRYQIKANAESSRE